ncbi:heat shock protein Hsp20 [Tepidicaulis marinus]|jgi:HSP20 family molecular chaperone IbpA|uniref:Heat shock protein Hsp20 n=1 Tax=Tepidicaulis marinus TaxID=1333998 RepID=A0A081BBF8_9HYPH|nr:Hsp20 family protein [Tepidicaulis marinus]GAK45376.1 heat shock protein Hsp20 [Tepidicaulis marinus]
MTRIAQFGSPFMLGFDEVERMLDRVTKTSGDGYPPYNVEQLDDEEGLHLRITLAVAGFSPDELSITLEDKQLVIRGRQEEDGNRAFLHRGIAARQFQRAFVLADGVEVTGAELANGLLSIRLHRPEPSKVVKQIEIAVR